MATVRKVAISGKFAVKLTKWHVKKGQEVVKDAILASYLCLNDDTDRSTSFSERKLKSRFQGKVTKILAKLGDEVPAGQPVIFIEENHCLHTIVMKEMCCECGEDLRKEAGVSGHLSEAITAEVPMVHNIPELRVSLEEAERIARHDERQLLKLKKLALVVDLDHTLVHTTHEAVPRDIPDLFHYQLPDHPFEYHTKLRPGAKAFLEAVSRFYELHIFTMGSRMYAHTIARHLDPDEKLFAHRIRSRDECLDYFSKSKDLRALFPCGDHMVCIIDDREDVWNFAPNLVTVKPYKFFKGIGDINDPFGNTQASDEPEDEPSPADKLEQLSEEERKENGFVKEKESSSVHDKTSDATNEDNDENENTEKFEKEDEETEKISERSEKSEGEVSDPADMENDSNDANHPPDLDDYLFYLEEILERIHRTFYSTLDLIKEKGGLSRQDPSITRFCTQNTISPDTRSIVPALRQQTLSDVNIVFTGVVPTNVPLKNSAVYRTAVSLGANVTDNFISQKSSGPSVSPADYTTHVVAARLGTEKAYRASRTPGVCLIGVDWLWCCSQRWERVDERLFPVPNRSKGDGTQGDSKRSTPIILEGGKRKKCKPKISEGAKNEEKLFSQDSVPSSEEMLESAYTVKFSKDELDEMDKEVEEYMLSDNDEPADVLGSDVLGSDVLGSISGSSSGDRSSTGSSSSSSSQNSTSSNPAMSLEDINERKRKLYDELSEVRKKKKALMIGDVEEENESQSSSSSSSKSSENSLLSEDDFQIGELLERQIND